MEHTLEGLTVEGEFPPIHYLNLLLEAKNDETPGIVTIKNSKLSGQAGWNNTIYVGDILEGTNFKEINIENVDSAKREATPR